MTRSDFIAAARNWLGTSFVHQGRLPGEGLDCAGLVVCAARSCDYHMTDRLNYSRTPAKNLFAAMVLRQCDQIELSAIQPGDLMLFSWVTEPHHIAIITEINPIMLIHSYLDVGKVVENGFHGAWEKRLSGCYRIKNIEDECNF